jgi:hypothetical protein
VVGPTRLIRRTRRDLINSEFAAVASSAIVYRKEIALSQHHTKMATGREAGPRGAMGPPRMRARHSQAKVRIAVVYELVVLLL